MCTGRVDPAFLLRAFAKGADGVFIGGCHLNECNYITQGNFYALRMAHLCKKLLQTLGISPERLSIEFISGGEANRFVELVDQFSTTIRQLGPLGEGEGVNGEALAFDLEAATKLVPFLKLLERERLRLRFRTRAEYDAFFGSAEFDRLFREAIGDKLAVSRIVSLLQQEPRSTRGISDLLGMPPGEVAKHLNSSSRQGLVRYDESQKLYAIA